MEQSKLVTYRIIQVLQLLHQLEIRLVLAVSDELLLRDTQSVLGADAAVPLRDPLVDPRLDGLLHLLVVLPDRDVEMQVRVTHVAVADHLPDGERLVVSDEAHLRQPLTAVLDELVQFRQRD